uniref:Carotenoid isomerooxygenase n=1 Tax=Heligmosomoides polygyrus TaxID=6339 RepID=A0A183G7U7_HELPZ
LASIPATDRWAPGYYHSFGITDSFFILFESPLRISLQKLIKMCVSSFISHDQIDLSKNLALLWRRHQKSSLKLRRMLGKKVTSDAFFTFHHANSYEKDGYLVLDYAKILNPGNLDDLLLEHMRTGAFRSKDEQSRVGRVPEYCNHDLRVLAYQPPVFSQRGCQAVQRTPGCAIVYFVLLGNPDSLQNSGFKPYIHRMIIPLSVSDDSEPGDNLLANCEFARDCKAVLRDDGSIHCTDMRICDVSMEFPRYCYDLNMQDYRYVYGSVLFHEESEKPGVCSVVTIRYQNPLFGLIVKVDLKEGNHEVWYKDSADELCGEPILVNRPDYTEEDEGVLIVPVVTTREGESPYVVVIDAATMKEQGRFDIPQSRIPLGFHSHYTSRRQ